MRSDKIFYMSWGIAIILIGVCVIIGLGFHLDLGITFILWLLSVGILIVILAMITSTINRKTALSQLITGEIITAISLGTLAIYFQVLDSLIALSLIIIIIGGGVIVLGMSRKE